MRSSERRIGREEALNRHMNFCKKFKALRPVWNPTELLISSVKQLILRSLYSPRSSSVIGAGEAHKDTIDFFNFGI